MDNDGCHYSIFLAHQIRKSVILTHGIEIIILPILSYPGWGIVQTKFMCKSHSLVATSKCFVIIKQKIEIQSKLSRNSKYFISDNHNNNSDWSLFQAVTFHFDCIVAEVKTEVHLFLMSSPKPDHDADYTDSLIYIGGMYICSVTSLYTPKFQTP